MSKFISLHFSTVTKIAATSTSTQCSVWSFTIKGGGGKSLYVMMKDRSPYVYCQQTPLSPPA